MPANSYLIYRIYISLRMLAVRMIGYVFNLAAITRSKASKPTAERNILLVARSNVAISHAIAVAELGWDHHQVKLFLFCPSRRRAYARRLILQSVVNLEFVGPFQAFTFPWATVGFCEHFLAEWFPKSARKIYLSHGIDTGKLTFDGYPYRYGFKALRTATESCYQLMLATHDNELPACAPQIAFKKRIIVTSDAMAEKLLRSKSKQTETRRTLNLTPQQKSILLMSTWGKGSLFTRHGEELLESINSALNSYRVFLTIHPSYENKRTAKNLVAELKKLGVEKIPDDGSWAKIMPAMDYAISDFSSATLYWFLLDRPLVFMGELSNRILPNSPILKIYEEKYHAKNWQEAVQILASVPPDFKFKKRPDEIFPKIGQWQDYQRIVLGEYLTTI